MLQGVILVLEPLQACLHFSGSTVQNTALYGGGDGAGPAPPVRLVRFQPDHFSKRFNSRPRR